MTKQQLADYIYLGGEIEDLRREKARLEAKCRECVTDTVVGSSPELPYSLHPITISGISVDGESAVQRKSREIAAKETELIALRAEIRQWIESISTSRIRRMMRYRYIDGIGWAGIAARLGYNSADAARVTHDRFLDKNL